MENEFNKRITISKIVFALVLVFLLIQLGIALFEYFRLAKAALTFPFPLDYGEGPILDQILHLAKFKNIYSADFSQPPFTVSNYPPLFHLIQVPFAWIFGPAYWYGRLISILSAMAAAFLIGLILQTLTGDWIASAIGGVTLLAFPYIVHWSVFDRVDSLALALSLGGLYAIVRRPESRRALWISGLLFTAAVYTRQSYALAGPLAAFIWLLQIKKRQQAFRLAAILAGSGLGLFIVLNILTQGGFYKNIVLANLNPFSWYNVTKYAVEIYLNAGFLLIGGFLFLFLERLGEWTRSWPLVIAYLAGAVLSSLTVGKAGSSVNYLYEGVAWLCLAAGAAIAWPKKNYWVKALIVFILAVQINGLVNWSREEHIPLITGKVADYREVAQMAEIVRQATGPVLADEYMGLLPLYGKEIYFQPFEYRMLELSGLWKPDSLVASIQKEEFPAIFLYLPRTWSYAIVERWVPKVYNAIYAHYGLSPRRLAENLVYFPKSTSSP